MMNRYICLNLIILLSMSACSDILATRTPTVVGTWETTIQGVVFDESVGSDSSISGATITYDVLHSYFLGLQEGRPNKTTSDQEGEFSLEVIVHDTDSIRIKIEAPGYLPYEERMTGIDLVAGKMLEVGLVPK